MVGRPTVLALGEAKARGGPEVEASLGYRAGTRSSRSREKKTKTDKRK